jgi:hypothetical protein
MLDTCSIEKYELERQFHKCNNNHSEILGRISRLDNLLVRMDEQRERMEEGGGVAIYPRPIKNGHVLLV